MKKKALSQNQTTKAESSDNLHILVVAIFGFIGLLTPFLLPVFFYENRIIGSLFGGQVIPLSFASAAVALVASNKVVESFRERRRQSEEDAEQ